MRNILGSALTAMAIGLACSATVQATESYPTKPIQLIIPFAPGDTDTMLRPFTSRMGQYLGQPLLMNYKPGAGGGLGANFTASSPADGYTLVGSSPGATVIVPLTNKELTYSLASFEPVAGLTLGGILIVVPAKSKYKTLADLVAAAKENPASISYGSSGALGITHLLGEGFADAAQVELLHVPFQGSAPAITALLGGHTEMAVSAVGPALAHIKSGALRALAIFSDERLSVYPDVPTLREQGFDIGSPTIYGLMAPKGTPPNVIDAIYQAAEKVVAEHGKDLSAALNTLGAEVSVLNPQEYADYLNGQNQLFTKVVHSIEAQSR